MKTTPPNDFSHNYFARTRRPNRKRRRLHFYEVFGQCSRCHDSFTVTLFVVHGELVLQETPRLQWRSVSVSTGEEGDDSEGGGEKDTKRCLVHRPDYCNGEVKLYDPTNAIGSHVKDHP